MSLLRDAVKRNKPKSENSVRSKKEASSVSNQINFLGNSTTRLGTGGAVNCSGNLGLIDMKTIEDDLQALPKKRKAYTNWTDENRWRVGEYASQNGNSAAVRYFKKKFPSINESTVRGFRRRYEENLKAGETAKKCLTKNVSPTGRPPLMGHLDEEVQKYLRSVADRGGIMSRAVAVCVAKSLIKRNPTVLGSLEINETWAQSLLRRMDFLRRQKTTDKVRISDGARKEIEYQFYHQITSLIERHNIPDELVINFDQTPCKMVPVGRLTMAKRNSERVVIAGSVDKRSFTGTFAVTLAGALLPIQLIYGGKHVRVYQSTDFQLPFLSALILRTTATVKKALNL